jgi:hypothetical protein
MSDPVFKLTPVEQWPATLWRLATVAWVTVKRSYAYE